MMLITQGEPSCCADRHYTSPTAATTKPARPMAAVEPGQRLRKCCDFCVKRKRKCDGDGVTRCSFCVATNQLECHYSVRLPTGPRPGASGRRASPGSPGKAAKATAPPPGGWNDGGGLVSDCRCSSKLTLKRARLSPSPATGLIGLRENTYIADFFRTIGFVPITSESLIRKAMVSTMFRAVQERDPGFHGCPTGFGGGEEERGTGSGDGGDVPRTGRGAAIESAAESCVLWSTVAVGCLMGGRPTSSVDEYARLAREALSGCFDGASVHAARAYTAIALLQDLRGNEEKFTRYIDFATAIVNALPPEEVPTDLADAHMIFKACDMFAGFDRLGEEDLRDAMGAVLGQAEEPIPTQQADVRRWLLKTDIRLLACFSMDMQNNGCFGGLVEAETVTALPGPGSGLRSTSGSDGDDDGGGDAVPSSLPHAECTGAPGTRAGRDTPAPRVGRCRSLSRTVAEPLPPGPISQQFAARVLRRANLMMHVTKSPEVRGGVGELYFWMITAYMCLQLGQPNKAVDGFLRCTDILVKSPGICRFSSWKHLMHVCLNCMVVTGNPGKYESLRTSYNSVADTGAPRAPPFEEFRGMSSICGNIFCRSVDMVFMAAAPPKEEASALCDVASAAPDEKAKPCPPETKRHDVVGDATPCASTAPDDESWARRVFDKRAQPQEVERLPGNTSPPAGPAAVVAVAPPAARVEPGAAPGFVASFGGGVGNEQRPRGSGGRFGFGQGAGSAGLSATGGGGASSNGHNAGTVSAGDVAAVTAAPWAPAGQAGNGPLHQQLEDWLTPLQRLSTMPSAQTSRTVAGPAGVGGLRLLHSSELEGAGASGLLDTVDELLGQPILEGFGEGGSEQDIVRLFGSNI